MPVLEGEPVRASHERAGRGGKFHLHDAPAGAEFVGRGEVECGELQFDCALVQSDDKVALQQGGVGRGFMRRDYVVAIAVNQGEHLFGDCHTGDEMDVQPETTRFDGHKRRLQILVKPMGENGGR